MNEKREPKVCTCTHLFRGHREFGTTARPNGPTTNRACAQCNCWRPVEAKP